MQIDLKTHFIKAIEADPNFSEAHLQLALLYEDEGDNKNVEDHFNLAIVSAVDQIHKLEKSGGELIKMFQFQNAKQKFMKAQDKRNHCAEVYYQQSIYFKNQNKICIRGWPTSHFWTQKTFYLHNISSNQKN